MDIERREEEPLEECPLCHLPKKLYPYGRTRRCHECILDLNLMKRRNLE